MATPESRPEMSEEGGTFQFGPGDITDHSKEFGRGPSSISRVKITAREQTSNGNLYHYVSVDPHGTLRGYDYEESFQLVERNPQPPTEEAKESIAPAKTWDETHALHYGGGG